MNLDFGDVGWDDQGIGVGKFYPFRIVDGERYRGVGPVGGLSMDASRSDVVYPTCVVSLLSFRSATGAPSTRPVMARTICLPRALSSMYRSRDDWGGEGRASCGGFCRARWSTRRLADGLRSLDHPLVAPSVEAKVACLPRYSSQKVVRVRQLLVLRPDPVLCRVHQDSSSEH